MKSEYGDIEVYVTRDGSLIRELMHPEKDSHVHYGIRNQSLAEATVPVGVETKLHRHHVSEELYHITAGQGLMTLAEDQFKVTVGDTICIPPGTLHCILNTGETELKFLCCCSPAYSHEDTELLG